MIVMNSMKISIKLSVEGIITRDLLLPHQKKGIKCVTTKNKSGPAGTQQEVLLMLYSLTVSVD